MAKYCKELMYYTLFYHKQFKVPSFSIILNKEFHIPGGWGAKLEEKQKTYF